MSTPSEAPLTDACQGFSCVPFSAHVPTLFLSTSIHDDYHRPGDTAEKVDLAQVERAVRLVLALAEAP